MNFYGGHLKYPLDTPICLLKEPDTPVRSLRACLHGGGGPHVGEVTRLDGVTNPSIYSLILIWSRLHDKWGDPRHVTSPIRGHPPPRKQALNRDLGIRQRWLQRKHRCWNVPSSSFETFSRFLQVNQLLKKGNKVGAEDREPRQSSDKEGKLYRLAVPSSSKNKIGHFAS